MDNLVEGRKSWVNDPRFLEKVLLSDIIYAVYILLLVKQNIGKAESYLTNNSFYPCGGGEIQLLSSRISKSFASIATF